MLFIPLLVPILGLSAAKFVKRDLRGKPIYGAKEIEEIIAKHLQYEGSISNFLKGTKANDTDGLNYADYNLDVSVLDIHNFRKLINLAKKKTRKRMNYRRAYEDQKSVTAGYKTHSRINLYDRRPQLHAIVVDKIYTLMLQSIYATKFRINDTLGFRRIFHEKKYYKLGLLYATIAHSVTKMESLYAQVRYFGKWTHYLWYLIIYEKLIQCNVDIEYAVGRMFQLHETADINERPPPRGAEGEEKAPKEFSEQEKMEQKINMEKEMMNMNPSNYDHATD